MVEAQPRHNYPAFPAFPALHKDGTKEKLTKVSKTSAWP
jgi:hypothetical protein